ncbi:MAG: fibronectin type III domain-containing protein [bacterium]
MLLDGLAPTAEYRFRVRAKNEAGGPGEWSGEYGPVTLRGLSKPGTPTGVAHTRLSDTSLTLAWQAPGDTGGGSLTYEVAQKVGLSAFDVIAITSQTSVDVTGLQPTAAYRWRGRAVNGGPAAGDWTAAYGPVTLRQVDPPSEPREIDVAVSGSSGLVVTWQAPVDPGSEPVTYDIEYTSDGLWLTHASTAATSTAITGLERGVAYSVRVAARNSGGASAWVSSGLTTIPEAGPPQAVDPRTIAVALRKSGRLYRGTLSWARPVGEVTAYRVRMKVAGKTWSAWVTYAQGDLDLADPRLLLRPMTPNTRYVVALQAVNASGRSAATTWAFATPRR